MQTALCGCFLPPRYRREERHLVAVADLAIHPRVIGVHRARNRSLVRLEIGELARELPPDRPDRRARCDLPRQLGGARDVPQPREQPHRHAHATRSAAARATPSSGSAVAPSIQTSPPSKNSCFQIGAICFTRSIAYRQAPNASARCADAAAIATLASPI